MLGNNAEGRGAGGVDELQAVLGRRVAARICAPRDHAHTRSRRLARSNNRNALILQGINPWNWVGTQSQFARANCNVTYVSMHPYIQSQHMGGLLYSHECESTYVAVPTPRGAMATQLR